MTCLKSKILHAAMLAVVVASVALTRLPAQELELTEKNFQQWREHILPGEGDLAWQQIPWLTTFADGILAADRADKPVLLWTMNGHPLGCK